MKECAPSKQCRFSAVTGAHSLVLDRCYDNQVKQRMELLDDIGSNRQTFWKPDGSLCYTVEVQVGARDIRSTYRDARGIEVGSSLLRKDRKNPDEVSVVCHGRTLPRERGRR